MKNHRIYFGKKFYRDIGNQGYWRATTNPLLYAHRWVWMMNFGEILPGMQIHHIDGNPSNNEIYNLQMVTQSQHMKFHWRQWKHDPRQLLLAI